MSGNNSTKFNFSDVSFGGSAAARNTWIICLTAICLMLLLHSWITLRFVVYAVKTKRKRSSMNGGPIIVSATVAIAMPFLRYLATFALMIVTLDKENDAGCEVVIDFGKVVFVMSMFCVYGFYWFRQRAFYQHPSLGEDFGKCSTVMSWASIFIMAFLAVAIVPVSVFPLEYIASPTGCVTNGTIPYPFREYFYSGLMLFSQILVLCLFIHPLKTYYNASKVAFQTKSPEPISSQESQICTSKTNDRKLPSTELSKQSPNADNSSSLGHIQYSSQARSCPLEMDVEAKRVKKDRTSGKIKNQSSRSNARVFRLIKRTLFLASLSVVTDLMAMIAVGIILPKDMPQVVNRLIYNVDMFINIATIVGSFEHWRRILIPTSCNATCSYRDRD